MESNKEGRQHWQDSNQQYLMTALEALRVRLEAPAENGRTKGELQDSEERRLQEIAESMSAPPTLDVLVHRFALSAFERDLLLMCAGIELVASFANVFAAEDGKKSVPTFGAALSMLPNAHWSAMTPVRPLRYWNLLELEERGSLTGKALKIDEWVLHFLVGLPYLDHRLADSFKKVRPYNAASGEIPTSHEVLAQRMTRLLEGKSSEWKSGPPPILSLCSSDISDHQRIAATACATLNQDLFAVNATDLRLGGAERKKIVRLWEREARLHGRCLLLQWSEDDQPELVQEVQGFLETIQGILIGSGQDAFRSRQRTMIRLEVPKLTSEEQVIQWKNSLGPLNTAVSTTLEHLVSQFKLDFKSIESVGAEAVEALADCDSTKLEHELESVLWRACRVQSRPMLDDLAHRVEMNVGWESLILPPLQRQTLEEVAIHVRQRQKVYEKWGFQQRGTHGLGITALFFGASGTGKTLAAAVLAKQLDFDLYQIDLSSMVSKYIGETEKNLRRVFDAAEGSGAILLFDEADALFGKRSDVKSSNDRYANMEVSYLLQRMEAYQGLAILTTNLKGNMDTAFLRRLRFTVQFPFPELQERAAIWSSVFPEDTPTQGLLIEKLAQLNVTGGNIKNIALNAAFQAAEEEGSVQMKHLLKASRSEYSKLEKPLTNAEIKGWL